MTYLLVNTAFLAVAVAVLLLARGRAARRGAPLPSWRALGLAGALMLALTLVFDNAMIAAGLVDYDPEQRLGLSLGLAPVEDFAYTLGALLLLPALWLLVDPADPAGTGRR